MSERKLYVGDDAESASDREILISLGYDPNRYHVASREDGPSGGGGEDSCYVTVELGMDRSKEDDDDDF